jgi:hypothetical protein
MKVITTKPHFTARRYARDNAEFASTSESRFEGRSEKMGLDVATGKNGDIEVKKKGAVVGYLWADIGGKIFGAVFATAKEFQKFLEVCKSEPPARGRKAGTKAEKAPTKKAKTPKKETSSGGRTRRTVEKTDDDEDDNNAKKSSSKKAEEREIHLDVNDEAHPADNLKEVLSALESELKHLGVTRKSENVRDLIKLGKKYNADLKDYVEDNS